MRVSTCTQRVFELCAGLGHDTIQQQPYTTQLILLLNKSSNSTQLNPAHEEACEKHLSQEMMGERVAWKYGRWKIQPLISQLRSWRAQQGT